MKKRNYLGFIAIIASVLFVLSCDKDDKLLNDGEEPQKEEAPKYLSINDQQDLLSGSALRVANTIDFAEYAELNSLVDTIFYGKKDIVGFFESANALLSDSIFAGKYELIREILRKDTLNLDLTSSAVKVTYAFEDSIIRYEDGSGEVELDTVINVKGVKVEVPEDGSTSLAATYLGQELVISMKLLDNSMDNVLSLGMDSAPQELDPGFEEYATNLSIPDLFALNISLNGKTLFDFELTLDTDMNVVFPFDEEGVPDLNGLKFNQFSKLVAVSKLKGGSFESESKLEFLNPDEGFRLSHQSKIDGRNLVQATYNLDASVGNLLTENGVDTYVLLGMLMNPTQLRGMDGTLSLGEDVTIKARILNPFGQQVVMSTISELMFSQNELTKEKAQPFLDSLNTIATLDVYFKGYDKAQAKLMFVYEDSALYENFEGEIIPILTNERFSMLLSKMASPEVATMVTGMLDRMNVLPVVVAPNDEGKEVYVRLDQYLSGIDLKTPAMVVVNKLGESLHSLPDLIMLLMYTFM